MIVYAPDYSLLKRCRKIPINNLDLTSPFVWGRLVLGMNIIGSGCLKGAGRILAQKNYRLFSPSSQSH